MEETNQPVERWIAFLRAINVGGHVVKMDTLRALFEEMGFSAVETFIASGNVIFTGPAAPARDLEQAIERHLRGALGYEVATFLRTAAELAEIARYRPFAGGDDEAGLYVSFTADAPGQPAVDRLMASRSADDDFHVHGREVYWKAKKKISESAFSGALLEKILGMPATMRNITTVRKMGAKYGP